MTKERLVEFLKENVFGKYKDNLIVLDNAGSHRNEFVKQAILESGNKYLFSVPQQKLMLLKWYLIKLNTI